MQKKFLGTLCTICTLVASGNFNVRGMQSPAANASHNGNDEVYDNVDCRILQCYENSDPIEITTIHNGIKFTDPEQHDRNEVLGHLKYKFPKLDSVLKFDSDGKVVYREYKRDVCITLGDNNNVIVEDPIMPTPMITLNNLVNDNGEIKSSDLSRQLQGVRFCKKCGAMFELSVIDQCICSSRRCPMCNNTEGALCMYEIAGGDENIVLPARLRQAILEAKQKNPNSNNSEEEGNGPNVEELNNGDNSKGEDLEEEEGNVSNVEEGNGPNVEELNENKLHDSHHYYQAYGNYRDNNRSGNLSSMRWALVFPLLYLVGGFCYLGYKSQKDKSNKKLGDSEKPEVKQPAIIETEI